MEQYTSFPNLIETNRITRPAGYSDEALFIYCVQYMAQNHIDLTPRQHNQWANIFFNWENSVTRVHKMSRVKQAYGIYFTSGSTKYTFDVNKIVDHFPELFDIPQNTSHETESFDSCVKMFLGMQSAIDKEIKESKDPRNRETYSVIDFREQELHGKEYIYIATLKTNEGSDPHFREGLRVGLRVGGRNYWCEVIDYDFENGYLYLTSPSPIHWRSYDFMRVTVDSSFILEGLQKRLIQLAQQTINPSYPICKFIDGNTEHLGVINHRAIPDFISEKLDESQAKAYQAALDKDITFIWGPPGTGKSFTLAAIIRALYQMKDERTAVCCVSNVAVDQLVNKVVDILEAEGKEITPGNFYRAGHTIDERILDTDFLFPNDSQTDSYRREIKLKKENLAKICKVGQRELSPQAIAYKAEIKELRQRLQDRTDYLVAKSRVVFSTISNFILSEKINQSQFDNLIVDEASMLAIPSLLALANKIAKRIILVGDFQQLNPIALVNDKWLTQNVFTHCGIDINHTTHPALYQLLNQRRSNVKIVDLINDTFYDKRLNATITEINDIAQHGPFANRIIRNIKVNDGALRFTKGGTRQNKPSALVVMDILDSYFKQGDFSFTIGLITPYKGQANLLRALTMEKHYPSEFSQQVKIGTIHTFQGSECDVIIYDVVDCEFTDNGRKANIGKIYSGKEGEQLLNVAISRARHQLIIVGDTAYMDRAPGNNMTSNTLKTFRKLNCY